MVPSKSSLAFTVVLGLVAVSCGNDTAGDQATSPTTLEVIRAQESSSTSFSSLSDLVSFADYVVVVTITDEEIGDVNWVDTAQTEGDINSTFVFRVDDRLLQHPSATVLPEEFSITSTNYWVNDKGARLAFAPEHGPRFEVGKSYVVGIVDVDGEWYPFNSSAAFLLIDGRIAEVDYDPGDAPIKRIVGMTVEELRTTLGNTPADPYEARYRSLPAPERFSKAQADRMNDRG